MNHRALWLWLAVPVAAVLLWVLLTVADLIVATVDKYERLSRTCGQMEISPVYEKNEGPTRGPPSRR